MVIASLISNQRGSVATNLWRPRTTLQKSMHRWLWINSQGVQVILVFLSVGFFFRCSNKYLV